MRVALVVIIGFSLTVIENVLESSPAVLLALTVKEKLPFFVGVPEIVPLFESVNPFGKSPLVFFHVIGVVPVASRVTE